MKKSLAILGILGALALTGCAARADTSGVSSNSDRSYYEERVEETQTKFVMKEMSDGSTLVCAISIGPDLAQQDCELIPVRY